jgi:putative lipoic acid-binding regulatory protein
MKHIDQKLEISYPCVWLYKIIGTEKDALISAVKEIFADSEHTLTFSKSSSKGKYISFNLEVTVHSEEARNFFFTVLRQHSSIKMVL